jgi:hypothetical protein
MRSPKFVAGCGLLALSLAVRSADATVSETTAAPTGARSSANTLYITISGPSEVPTWWTCSWNVYVSGGTPPYTVHWGAEGMIETDSSDEYWQGYAAIGGNVALDVSVTDAANHSGWGYKVIDSSSNAPFCLD